MYNRYNASTGTYMSIPEPGDGQRRERPLRRPEPEREPPREEPEHNSPPQGRPPQDHVHSPPPRERPKAPARPPGHGSGGQLPGLERLLSGFSGSLNSRLSGLETEDLLLLAVVYLMYRQSGDRQLLIVLAALLLF